MAIRQRIDLLFEAVKKKTNKFQPVRLPDIQNTRLDNLSGGIVESLKTDISASLRAQKVDLPITKENKLNIQVLKDTSMKMQITANKSDNDSSIIRSVQIDFSKPLILDDIIPALAGLPSLFEDKNIKNFKGFLENLGGDKLIHQFVDLGANIQTKIHSGLAFLNKFEKNISENLALFNKTFKINPIAPVDAQRVNDKSIPMVYLTNIQGQPKYTGSAWQLDLSFSGQVIYMGQPLSSFKNIKMPTLLIPGFHAELEKFFTDEPLSSADLQHSNLLLTDILDVFNKLLHKFSAEFQIDGQIPDIIARIILPSGSRLKLKHQITENIHITGSVNGEYHQGKLKFEASNITCKNNSTKIKIKSKGTIVHNNKKSVLPALKLVQDGKSWKEAKLSFQLLTSILPGSSTGNSDVALNYFHPHLKGLSRICLISPELYFSGSCTSTNGNNRGVQLTDIDFNFHGLLECKEKSVWNDGKTKIFPHWRGNLQSGKITRKQGGPIQFQMQTDGPFQVDSTSSHDDLPEFGINQGSFQSALNGYLKLSLNLSLLFDNNGFKKVSLKDSKFSILAEESTLTFDKFSIILPKNMQLQAWVPDAYLNSTGQGNLKMNAEIDPASGDPKIYSDSSQMNLFFQPLVTEQLSLDLVTGGEIKIKQSEYNSRAFRFFGVLFGNEFNQEDLESFLEDQAEWRHLTKLTKFVSSDLHELFQFLRRLFLVFRKSAKQEKITSISDIFPAESMKRLISKALSPASNQQNNLLDILNNILDAKPFDKKKARAVLDSIEFPDTKIISREGILNLCEVILNPIAYESGEDPTKKEKPLVSQPKYQFLFKNLPDANEIYEKVSNKVLEQGFEPKLLQYAHYLKYEQLKWINQNGKSLSRSTRSNIQFLIKLKERIHLAKERYGSVAFLTQGLYLNFFLSEVTELLDSRDQLKAEKISPLIEPGYLSPEDIAILLQATLAAPIADRTVQLNQFRILKLIEDKSPDFLFQVFIEMSDGTPRVLANALYAILECDLGLLRVKVNTREILAKKIGGLPPERARYVQDSNLKTESYLYELIKLSENILKQGEPYMAVKHRLQSARQPVVKPLLLDPTKLDEIKLSIQKADSFGTSLNFIEATKAEIKTLHSMYKNANDQIKKLVKGESSLFENKLLKEFLGRNLEALQIYSILDNYKEDVDQVREWLHLKSGQSEFAHDQHLISAIIRSLYQNKKDQKRLLADPLVCCLLPPETGTYDFTVISCMGIITGGKTGTELSKAYKRLKEKRGIHTVRADTKTMRSLKSNSFWVHEAIKKAKTPFGLLGYSQGCANALTTESNLYSGTPLEQNLISNLKSRNLLFSAANGSVHGSCGDKKLVHFYRQLDLELREYQGTLSDSALKLLIQSTTALFSSKFLSHLTGGIYSIKRGSNLALARDGQFMPISTCTIRGVFEADFLPESLNILANMLSEQSKTTAHDTQVSADDQRGFLVANENAHSKVLRRLEIPSAVQRIHHWSPLREEVSQLTTSKDKELCVFDSPKDRHVFPWIDLNIRFGIIKKKRRKK